MKTLIIDNYDSFTYNLYQYFGELGANPVVFRNDTISIPEITSMNPTHIVISPGPGDPRDAHYFGICADTISAFSHDIPTLGVCLGHQGIGHIFGGEIILAPSRMHGKTSQMIHTGHPLFEGISTEFTAMRYHSLLIKSGSLPPEVEVIATTKEDGLIMALAHKTRPLFGLQFHPESIGTPDGKTILKNFLNV